MTEIMIRPMRYGGATAQALVSALLAEMTERFGAGDDTPVESIEFDPPDGSFLVAYVDGQPVGCGGWRTHDDEGLVAEIKRMYTVPEARGRGIARAVLSALENSARENGRERLVLETGDRMPEAIRLYETAGYERIPNFGFHQDEPGCLSYGRQL